jgi:adenine-specific DNA-methyltransferase
MSDARVKFQGLLRELFQFDCADLDFGIYRIMNQKRAVIERFIENDLMDAVGKELRKGALKEQGDLAEQLDALAARIREDIADDAIDADGQLSEAHAKTKLGRQYQELRAKAAGAMASAELEAQVFNHLWAFFCRYYDNGDFLSMRRYSRREKYAIPYNGEEVHFHWANRDQYYIKTGETFTDYQWKTGKVSVVFKLVQAETEKDNVKSGTRRFFVPRLDEVFVGTRAEARGELPAEAGTLTGETVGVPPSGGSSSAASAAVITIPFEYRGLTEQEGITYGKKNQQDAIVAAVLESLPRRKALRDAPTALAAIMAEHRKTDKGVSISRLEHHLRRYAGKNTRDYFIHKDLGGFLTRELDFYLKNEVLVLDDLVAGGAERAEGWFQLLEAIRAVGGKIITFLAQIEDFQKRVFEKRKLVTETHYCFTLDRVPKELWPAILKNKAQIAEWKTLYSVQDLKGYSEPLKTAFLAAWPSLMIDTAFFADAPDFVDTLLASQQDLDESLGGLLVHSENFQALNLLQSRFKEQVKCVYIDPPYNTGGDGFLYKDSYQHSAWLSMMSDRLIAISQLQPRDGTLTVSIDDAEVHHLLQHVRTHYGDHIATLVWDRNRKNDAKFFSVGHEYMCVFGRDVPFLKESGVRFREPKEGLLDAKTRFERLRKKYADSWDEIRHDWLRWFDDIPLSDPCRRLNRFNKVNHRGPYRDDGNINWPGGGGPRYEILHPVTGKPCKIPVSGWRYPTAERFWEEHAKGRISFGNDETTVPSVVTYLFEGEDQVMPSVFYSYAQTAAQEFDSMFGARVFDNPKNWRDIARVLRYLGDTNSAVADVFAGSGTTGHAVIQSNREDDGCRTYSLVEMGPYFDTIIKPRIQKVVFSADWRSGKPVVPNNGKSSGISHAFKYIRLESYEDALGNIAFDQPQGEMQFDDYVLRYMLGFETRQSETLLNVEKLSAPFAYKLDILEGGERKTKPVDLPETFNCLLGLKVGSRTVHLRDGKHRYLVVEGKTNPHGEGGERKVCVIWRDVTGWTATDFKADAAFVKQEKLGSGADEVFVNADSVIPGAHVLDAVFKERMFAPVNL